VAITRVVAERLGEVAQGLRKRGLDATEVARFLDRIVFCLFAEDVGLLPKKLFSNIVEKSRDPEHFSKLIGQLFAAMNEGGDFGLETIRHFNGNLFIDSPVLELTRSEIRNVQAAARLDWSAVDPSIFGTLFERGLDPNTRAQLGAQYTSREDIETLVEPVVMTPLRREWADTQAQIESLLAKGKTTRALREARTAFRTFHHNLAEIKVLDPACGSGNFLYVTLQKMKDLEKQALIYAGDRDLGNFLPLVGPWQFYGIEINPYAFDLAQTTLWIGYLQWIQANGFGVPGEPILRRMDNFKNMDAILDLSDSEHPKEPEWPAVDFVIGNPPFLGGNRLRHELSDQYVNSLFEAYQDRVPATADLCGYWFEMAREHLEKGKCKRVGLLATQGIRGGANRKVLKRIKATGDIFFAESDRNWILDGANVHVSMVGYDDGTETSRTLNGLSVTRINSNLTSSSDTTQAQILDENANICFRPSEKGGKFEISFEQAVEMCRSPNPNGLPNSNVLRPWTNGTNLIQIRQELWIIDFATIKEGSIASLYERPYEYLKVNVDPERASNRDERLRKFWWLHRRSGEDMRRAVVNIPRMICTPRVSKHRLFVWIPTVWLPDTATYVFARSDDYCFGILHSRPHEVWARAQGTQVRERESGFRYTPTTCFETFPFPKPTEEQREAIGKAAKELDELRTNWLNPSEWTRAEILEFPGSIDGPWARYVHDPNEHGIGTVKYPRIVPKGDNEAEQLAKRTLTNLYNERPTWLDLAHRKLDEAVFAAYGWDISLSDDEILAHLLELNQERSAS
jgi:type II restriction/modification system DNA methylase subunit YeeA